MAWNVEHSDEFLSWWEFLTEEEQKSVAVAVGVLEEKGPSLGRPLVDTLRGSRIPNLKELRIQHAGKPYRVLFVFDPRQSAILLIGGVKGGKGWYRSAVEAAEKIYAAYLRELKKEGLI